MSEPTIKSLKIKEAHLIINNDNVVQPMIQLFFEDENHFTHAVAMPLSIYNNPPNTPKGNA